MFAIVLADDRWRFKHRRSCAGGSSSSQFVSVEKDGNWGPAGGCLNVPPLEHGSLLAVHGHVAGEHLSETP